MTKQPKFEQVRQFKADEVDLVSGGAAGQTPEQARQNQTLNPELREFLSLMITRLR